MEKFFNFLRIIGAMLLITVSVFSITYMGFMQRPDVEVKYEIIPDFQTLCIFNSVLGLAGGALIDFRRLWASLAGGFMAAAGITALTLLYVSWRSSILNAEILIPLFVGIIPGVVTYNFLREKIYGE